jgi:hypothetical protein
VPSLDDIQRDIRRALRCAQTPSKLFTLPLIETLGRIYALNDPLTILRRLVDDALPTKSDVNQRLHQLIIRCDIERTASQKGFADEMHVTYRQFHRIRGEAIRSIASYVARLPELQPVRAPQYEHVEALAALLAEQEPSAAGRLFDLLGDQAPLRTHLMHLRARVDSGEEIDSTSEGFEAVPGPVRFALIAQSKIHNGKPLEAHEYLARVHAGGRTEEIDDTVIAELDWLAFLRAKYAQNARDLAYAAKALANHAPQRQRSALRAVAARATSELHNGTFDSATASIASLEQLAMQMRDGAYLGIATMLRAQLAIVQGDFRAAMRLAHAGHIALSRHLLAVECASTYARAAMMAGEPFEVSIPKDATTWMKISYDVTCARAALGGGRPGEAEAILEPVIEQATRLGYIGVAAKAAATLGAALDARGSHELAAGWYLDALQRFTETQSHLVAFDLFSLPGAIERDAGPLAMPPLLRFLFLRLCVALPQAASDNAGARASTVSWLETIVRIASDAEDTGLERAAFGLARSGCALARFIEAYESDITRVLSLAIFPLFRYDRQRDAKARISAAIRQTVDALSGGRTEMLVS